MLISLLCPLQKNVYSVFRANPPSIGFAQLSSVAGGSGERECSLVFPLTSSLLLPLPGATSGNHSSTTTTSNGPSTRNGSPTTTTGKGSSTTSTGSGSSSTFPPVSAYLFLTTHFTADGGSSTRITLPVVMTTAMMVVMCLL
jgi:hypothetical protein